MIKKKFRKAYINDKLLLTTSLKTIVSKAPNIFDNNVNIRSLKLHSVVCITKIEQTILC